MSTPEMRLTLENVFGTIGTILWCIQLLPQIYMNYKRKTTFGLTPYLYIGWILSGLLLGIYTVVQNINIPLMLQPHAYGSLCAIIFVQMLYYDRKWSVLHSLGALAFYAIAGGGFEVGMYFACLKAQSNGITGLTIAVGVGSAIFLAGAFVPQIWWIIKHAEVIGISYLFLAIDCAGAIFSIMSLAFKDDLDIVAACGYAAALVLELLVLLLAAILNPRARRRRRMVKEEEDAESIDADRIDESKPEERLDESDVDTEKLARNQKPESIEG